MNTRELILCIKRLGALSEAHIPLAQSLTLLAHQSRPKLKNMYLSLAENIKKGQSLSSELSLFPKIFPKFMTQMIKAGEESGTLHEQMQRAAGELERQLTIKRNLMSVLIYPCIVAFGTIFLSLFLIVMIFPKVKNLFQGLHVPLPFTTKLILWFSLFLRQYWLLILVVFSLTIIIYYFLHKKYPAFKIQQDTLLLKIPGINSVIKNHTLSTALRTLSLMLKARIPISLALEHTSNSLSHSLYIDTFTLASKQVLSGKKLSTIFSDFPILFSPTVIHIIEVGEISGTLEESCLYISRMLQEETEDRMKFILTVIEPALMALMGLIVGFISLSIITPIYEITQNLKH